MPANMGDQREAALAAKPGLAVAYFSPTGEPIYDHEICSINAVARSIAEVRGFDFARRFDGASNLACTYFIPDDTLLAVDAHRLGIRGPDDLYGGVVPRPFIRTKVISHELVDERAERPAGWSSGFGKRIRGAVLPGWTAFSRGDAITAAVRLLPGGPVRVKDPRTSRGCGQTVVSSVSEFEEVLDRCLLDEMAESGLVIETNLQPIQTLSVGHATIDGMRVSYYGKQRIAPDNHGRPTYGGSDLVCVRGGWSCLMKAARPLHIRQAIAQAIRYEEATREYPGFFASRCNYDVGQGIDGSGRWHSGVLESSWRVGGSSTAEIAAFAALRRAPSLPSVSASAVKEFGEKCSPPAAATVHFRGYDPVEGPVTRYTFVREHRPRSFGLRPELALLPIRA